MLDNLKNIFNKKNDSKNSNTSSSKKVETAGKSPSDKDVASAKQRSTIVKVIVALGLAYLAFDHFLAPEELPVPIDSSKNTVSAPTVPKKKKKREEAATAPDAGSTNNQGPSTAAPVINENSQVVPPPAPESLPTENTNVLPKENIETPELKIGESHKAPEVDNSQKIDELINQKIDLIDSQEAKKEVSNLESKIVQENIYIEPPNYEKIGRGLVYNCKGKHWACVEKEAYLICNKNMVWNNTNGKPSECISQNVYASEDDCNIIQKYNISTNVSTDFCKN